MVREHPYRFELVGLEKVRFIDFTDRWEPLSRSDLRLCIGYMSATAQVC
jgi:hypothetical protein